MIPKKFKTAYVMSFVILGLALLESAGGLLFPGLFRDNPYVVAAFRGNDLVTLFLAAPVLAWALCATARGSLRAQLVWMAMLGYMIYNYAFYLFGTAFNAFFLVYVALMSLSILALIFSAPRLDVGVIAASVRRQTPVRGIAVWMVLFGGMLGSIWVMQSLNYIFTGVVPTSIDQFDHPTSIVFALDLGLLIPFLLLGAVLLWQRNPWGYVLGVAMNVKSTTYALALIAMSWFANDFDLAAAFDPLTIFFSLLGVGTVTASVLLLGNMQVGKK